MVGFGCRKRSTASFITCSATFPPTVPVTTSLSTPCDATPVRLVKPVSVLNKGFSGIQPHQGIYKIKHFIDESHLHHRPDDGDGTRL